MHASVAEVFANTSGQFWSSPSNLKLLEGRSDSERFVHTHPLNKFALCILNVVISLASMKAHAKVTRVLMRAEALQIGRCEIRWIVSIFRAPLLAACRLCHGDPMVV